LGQSVAPKLYGKQLPLGATVVVGTWKLIAPPEPISLPASAPMFACRKSSPGLVTLTSPAPAIVCAAGKPAGSGWMPQLEQPLEHPPPLHEATMKRRRTIRP
jgi:hypothetical protein